MWPGLVPLYPPPIDVGVKFQCPVLHFVFIHFVLFFIIMIPSLSFRMASKIIQCGAQLSGRLCGHVKVAHTKHVQKYLGVLSSPRLYSNSVSASAKSSAADSSIYDREFSKSLNNPTEYWGEAAEKLVWHKKWDRVIDDSKSPFTSWYVILANGFVWLCMVYISRRRINTLGWYYIIFKHVL